MDGIAGIISPFKQLVRQERLKQMVPVADTQESEKESRWIDPQETTGFAVEGTHTAIQHYRHYTLLLNGRIYNSRPLKNRLQQEGYLFPTGNDCELIGAAYDLWKEKCLEKLDGKFAFALHDGQTGDLLLVRDRFGEKPLYYYGDFRERGRFVQFLFASQMKALWRAGAPKQLDGTMVLNYLTLGYVQNPNKKMATFYSDILSLPPGHYLKIMPQAGRVQMRRWYRLDWHINTDRTVEDGVVRFRELFLQSVTQRAEGWPVIGCKEDAGITASAIRAALPPIAGRKVFSIIPPSDNTGNRHLSGQQQVVYRPEKSEPVEDFYRLCDGQEQPFADIRILRQYRFFRWAAAQGIPVLLDPLGGLEILGGHPSYIACFLQGLIRKDYNTFKKEKSLFLQHGFLAEWNLRNYIAGFAPEKTAEIQQKRAAKKQNHFPGIDHDFLLRYQNTDTLRQPEVHSPEDLMYYHLTTVGLEEKLRVTDCNAAAFSLEVHLPFLQHGLVEFLFSLPGRLKFHDGFSEWILRKSMEKLLPQEVIWPNVNSSVASEAIPCPLTPAVVDNLQEARNKLIDNKILASEALHIHPSKDTDKLCTAIDWRIWNMARFLP